MNIDNNDVSHTCTYEINRELYFLYDFLSMIGNYLVLPTKYDNLIKDIISSLEKDIFLYSGDKDIIEEKLFVSYILEK